MSTQWYARLGFKHESEHRFAPNLPAFVEISNGNLHLLLSEHAGDAIFGATLYLRVPDVDTFAADFLAEIQPQGMRWGMREIMLEDPDGNSTRIGSKIT